MSVLRILAVALLVLSGCKKDDATTPANNGDYYFRATFNGTKKDFSHVLKFQGGGNDGRWEHIVVGGHESAYPTNGGPLPPSYDFELWRVGGNITPGTYQTQSEQEMISRYAIQTSNGTLLYNTLTDGDNFTLVIEELSNKGIKGTCHGTIRNYDGEAIIVTDGEFNMPYDVLVNP